MSKPSFCLVSLYNFEAMGLRSIHSILRKNGFTVKMIFLKDYETIRVQHETGSLDLISEVETQLFKETVVSMNPDFLGFSLVSTYVEFVQGLMEGLKLNWNGKVILGGIQPTLNPEESIEFADIICRGEGELPILNLANCTAEGKDILSLKNFWFKLQDGQIIENSIDYRTSNLDQYPVPELPSDDCFVIDNDTVNQEDPYTTNTRYGIMAFRGCPYSCSYCSNSGLHRLYSGESASSRLRGRSVDHVIEELARVKKVLPKVSRINFYDEVFIPPPSWLDEFCSRYKQEINLPFYCMFHPGAENEDLVMKLKEAGLEGIWLGIQSGSERIRREVLFRKYSNETALKTAGIFYKHGVSIRYDFILDNPFEAWEDKIQTIEILTQLPTPYTANFFSLVYFPNTDLTMMALEKGFISEEHIEGNSQKSFDNWTIRMGIDDFTKSKEDIFINHLAFFIAKHAEKGTIPIEHVNRMIRNFEQLQSYTEIRDEVAQIQM